MGSVATEIIDGEKKQVICADGTVFEAPAVLIATAEQKNA